MNQKWKNPFTEDLTQLDKKLGEPAWTTPADKPAGGEINPVKPAPLQSDPFLKLANGPIY